MSLKADLAGGEVDIVKLAKGRYNTSAYLDLLSCHLDAMKQEGAHADVHTVTLGMCYSKLLERV